MLNKDQKKDKSVGGRGSDAEEVTFELSHWVMKCKSISEEQRGIKDISHREKGM